MGSTLGSTTLSFTLDHSNDDTLWVKKTVNIAGTIIQQQYIDDWPRLNSKICAIVVNKVAWYGIHLIYYDERSNRCIQTKIIEIYQKKDIVNNVNKIVECLRKSPIEPWKELYANFNIDRQPPFIKIQLIDRMMARPGDMIRVYRGMRASRIGFYHYGIYIDDDKIVHVTSPQVNNIEFKRLSANGSITSGTVETAFVQITDWKTFVLGDKFIEVIYTPLNYYSVEQRVENAINAADNEALKGKYNVLENNCEHFSRFILYGYKHSKQADKFNVMIRKKSHQIVDLLDDNLLSEEEMNSYNQPTILFPNKNNEAVNHSNNSDMIKINQRKHKKKRKRRNVPISSDRL